MKIYVCRRKKKNDEGTYLALVARADWGQVLLSYDINTILQVIPYGIDHRSLDAIGIEVGEFIDEI